MICMKVILSHVLFLLFLFSMLNPSNVLILIPIPLFPFASFHSHSDSANQTCCNAYASNIEISKSYGICRHLCLNFSFWGHLHVSVLYHMH